MSRIRDAVWGEEMLKTPHFPLTAGFRLQVCSLVLVRVAAVMVKASAESPELMWTGAIAYVSLSLTISVSPSSGVKYSTVNES